MVRLIRILWLAQLLTRAVRLFMPWVARMFTNTVGLVVVTVITFWGGVPAKADAIANEWLDRAYLAGFPGDQTPALYWVFYVLAWICIVIGWSLMSLFTVAILALLF